MVGVRKGQKVLKKGSKKGPKSVILGYPKMTGFGTPQVATYGRPKNVKIRVFWVFLKNAVFHMRISSGTCKIMVRKPKIAKTIKNHEIHGFRGPDH